MLEIILTLVVIGFILWLVTTFIPMEPRIKQILVGFIVILVVIWILSVLLGGAHFRLPKIS